ncbi:SR-related protein LDC2-like protein [Dinothrombium tinctorium]|uniref:SR-related protein LDC2-like protein n=1 Tax=Dinothrombium tinctorium TaxID=1965070 RepID=A0A443QPS4_9ACAR|nr:SR-related protein LDC2-like protein [Dinothrombium tinctorium]
MLSSSRSSSSSASSSHTSSSRSRSQSSSSSSSRSSSASRGRRGRSVSPKPKRALSPKVAKIHIGRLTRNVTKDHLLEIFNAYGVIKSVDLPIDRIHPHLSRGFAYVEYEKAEDAEKAIKYMDGGQIDGQEISVSLVLTPKPRPFGGQPPIRRGGPPGWGHHLDIEEVRDDHEADRDHGLPQENDEDQVQVRRVSTVSTSFCTIASLKQLHHQ